MSTGRRAAFTLLELMLTLALAVMLMALLGTALSFYALKLDARDSEVRRVQLAQAILNMISDDLRVALYPPEFDPAALDGLLSSVGGGGEAPGAGQDLSAAGLDDLSGSETDEFEADDSLDLESVEGSVETSDLSTGTTITSRPGLLGNQTQIQFDISRVPRLEEYQQQIVGDSIGELVDVPSDIKTVTYFIQAANGGVVDPLDIVGNKALSSSAGPTAGGGLVRRALDRAVTSYALETGGATRLLASGDLIATEVVGLEFRYWDGLQWQFFWDSDENGALPIAIEVTLTMLDGETSSDNGLAAEPRTRQFQQVIRLPMGQPMSTDTTSGMGSVGL